MATIDDKVVAMSFESSKFESGVSSTLSSIDRLKAALNFHGAGKGLQDIDAAGKRVDLSHIGRAVDDIRSRLNVLSVAALAVFANIASKAVSAGANLVKAFTLDPVKAGFQEYATNLNAVQTILANTQASGATLTDVNAALLDLNKYSDKTIYNFSQMAKNIGTFTAAGVDLKTSTQAIKGIANLAALSGSNADQAATAMYQLSQAISAGRVGLQDWNSVVNAGMGGTVFQRALAQTAVQMGTLKDGTLKLVGPMKNVSINGESFRQSMQAGPGKKSWLTSGVLTETLKQFTGDLTNAQLKAKGFTDAQIKSIQTTAQTAMHAATEVKTFSQVIDVAKETAGSGWAQTWQIIFGNFGEAKTLFTGVSNAINGFINASSSARNKVLGDWKALGGRTVLISAIKTAFQALGEILKPIKEAFREIFPPKTGQDLFNLTKGFQAFAEAMKPSQQTVDNLKRTFKGFFALLDIGKQIIGGIFTVFGQLFGSMGAGQGGFLSLTGSIGDFLVKIDEALKKGGRLHNFFLGLGAALSTPIKFLAQLAKGLAKLFDGFSSGGFTDQLSGMTKAMSPLQKIMSELGKVWDNFTKAVGNSGNVIGPAFDALIQLIQNIGPAVGKAVSGMNFQVILEAIRTGLFGGLVLMLKQFLGRGSILNQLGGGIFKNIAGSFNALQGSMVAMQNNIRAKTLKEIAIAIALLTASVVALSFVDPKKLTSSITAMGFMFAELLVAMKILDKIGTGAGFIKLPVIAGSLILLATAIDILTIAVFALSRLSWEQLLKGLGGVGVLLIGISAASVVLSANSSGMIRAGIGITAMAVGINILAVAVRIFAMMSWGEMIKGLAGVAGGLVAVAAGMKLMPKGMIVTGAGLVIVAGGLKLLASAMMQFAGMDWNTMSRGIGGISAALIVIATSMRLMPKNMIGIALGLWGISAALKGVAQVIGTMGKMSVEQLVKGITGLAGSLLVLAVGLNAMAGTAAGATALAIAAAGLALFIPALVTLGKQSVGTIVTGLIALAAALGILIAAGLLIAPVVPALLGLGAALVLMGAGMALAGAGVALLAAGISALVVAGPTGVGILIAALEELARAVPRIAKDFVLAFLAIVDQLAATAPKFVDALLKILDSLLKAIIESSPKIAKAFDALVTLAIQILTNNQGRIIQAGFNLIIALLQGVKNNIGQVVTSAVDIVTKFLGSLASNIGKIVAAGAQVLVSLVKGILNGIAAVPLAAINVVTKFLEAIANSLGKVAIAGLNILTKLLTAISSRIGDVIRLGADIIVKFVTGIGNAGVRIVTAGVDAITRFINAVAKGAVKLVDVGATAIINFLNGVASVLETRAPEMRAAGARIGVAIVDGMTFGLASKAGELASKAASLAHSALSAISHAVGHHSPATEAMVIGLAIADGLALGMSDTRASVAAASALGNSVITTFTTLFQTASPSKVMNDIGQQVGQGFAQGLMGSADNIKAAFTDMNNKLTDQMSMIRDTIGREQDNLENLLKEKQAKIDDINKTKFKKEADKAKKLAEITASYAEPIAKAQAVITQNEALLARVTAGHIALTKTLRDEKVDLIALSNEYDKVSEKLKEATQALADAKKIQDDALKSFEDQYAAPPDISGPMTEEIKSARDSIATEQGKLNDLLAAQTQDPQAIAAANAAVADAQAKFDTLIAGKVLNAEGTSVDQLATYTAALKNQTDVVGAYNSTLQQLRKLGLDDETYQKLLKEGSADQQFASQLLAGGKTAVASLNTLDTNLQTVSKTLATNAAKNLYQAGVDAAQGLVNGLQSKQSALRKAMEALAEEIVRALKKKLKIKSPSEEFALIGQYAMEGMAFGFLNSSKVVTDAIDVAAQDAMTAMQRSMRDISNAVTDELNPNPVITPILDLTEVKNRSQELAALTNAIPITAAASFGQAAIISSEQRAVQEEQAATVTGGTPIKFEQNNYSPESLTPIEIYRQTRNQLSQLKSVLVPT